MNLIKCEIEFPSLVRLARSAHTRPSVHCHDSAGIGDPLVNVLSSRRLVMMTSYDDSTLLLARCVHYTKCNWNEKHKMKTERKTTAQFRLIAFHSPPEWTVFIEHNERKKPSSLRFFFDDFFTPRCALFLCWLVPWLIRWSIDIIFVFEMRSVIVQTDRLRTRLSLPFSEHAFDWQRNSPPFFCRSSFFRMDFIQGDHLYLIDFIFGISMKIAKTINSRFLVPASWLTHNQSWKWLWLQKSATFFQKKMLSNFPTCSSHAAKIFSSIDLFNVIQFWNELMRTNQMNFRHFFALFSSFCWTVCRKMIEFHQSEWRANYFAAEVCFLLNSSALVIFSRALLSQITIK